MLPRQQCNLPFRQKYWSDIFYFSSSIKSIVGCCTTPSICSSSNDSLSLASLTICSSHSSPRGAVCSGSHSTFKFRGLGVVEANPSSTNADQTVLKTVNNAVQWVTSSLLPSAASQSENQLWFYDLILSGRLFNQMSSGSWAFRHLSPSLEKKPLMIPWPSWSMGQSSQRANRRFYNSNFHSVRQTHGTQGVQFLFFPIFWTYRYSYFLLFLN